MLCNYLDFLLLVFPFCGGLFFFVYVCIYLHLIFCPFYPFLVLLYLTLFLMRMKIIYLYLSVLFIYKTVLILSWCLPTTVHPHWNVPSLEPTAERAPQMWPRLAWLTDPTCTSHPWMYRGWEWTSLIPSCLARVTTYALPPDVGIRRRHRWVGHAPGCLGEKFLDYCAC